MARWFAFATAIVVFGSAVRGAEELPQSDPEESFEIEPPHLIPYRNPDNSGGALVAATPTPAVDIERLSKAVERAKRSAISAERLFRIGVFAKIEAEQRALKAVRLEANLENARLAQAKAGLVVPENTKPVEASVTNDAELARAIEAAHAATKKLEQAELAAAEANLTRQQKLLSLGSGRKADVARAERKLAELKAARE